MKLRKVKILFRDFNYKGGGKDAISTLLFNLRMFPLRIAIRLPVLITSDVHYKYSLPNSIIFDEDALYYGSLRLGFIDRQFSFDRSSFIKIKGRLIIHGAGFHCFAKGTTLEVGDNAVCEIGSNFSASHNNRIRVVKYLRIGSDNMWSYDNVIMDNDGHRILDENGVVCNSNKGIIFGDKVWLGCRNIVLKGAKVSNNTIVAPGSIINKDYSEENCIISSFGKIIKKNTSWSRDLM